MSVQHSPEHGVAYHLVCYDAAGRERRGRHGMASEDVLTAAGERPTDLFLFSHGWNADPSGAIEQYGRWLDAMAARSDERERLRGRAGGFRPLLVGLHWPSKAWADEELARISYAVGDAPAAGEQNQVRLRTRGDPMEQLIADYAGRLGNGLEVREAVRRIVESAVVDAAPPTLPDHVREAYTLLNDRLELDQSGEGAAPGDDRDPFDPEETYQSALLLDVVDPLSYGGFSLGGILAPLRVLSFWAMKRRARSFGESGASDLLRRLQGEAPDARVHVMGHSFGCIVASAAVAGAPGAAEPGRAVDTLVLAQGAMSLWSFCRGIPAYPDRDGYFHGLVRNRLVRGPIIVTTSRHDRAVRVFYPLGAGLRGELSFDPADLPRYGGIGTFGIRGPGIEIQDEQLAAVDETYRLRLGVVYNLNADAVITRSAGIQGAHSDISHPQVARAVWRAVEG